MDRIQDGTRDRDHPCRESQCYNSTGSIGIPEREQSIGYGGDEHLYLGDDDGDDHTSEKKYDQDADGINEEDTKDFADMVTTEPLHSRKEEECDESCESYLREDREEEEKKVSCEYDADDVISF